MKPEHTDSSLHPISETSLPVMQTVARVVAWVFAWLASIKLADVQLVVSIVGGLAVLMYTALNTYVLWRDKVRRKTEKETQ